MAKNDKVPETTVAGQPTESSIPPELQKVIDAEVAKRMAVLKPIPQVPGVPTTDLSQLIADGVAKAMAAVMPTMAQQMGMGIMSAQQAMAMSEHEKILVANKAKLALQEKCHICRQPVGDGKGRGCGGPWKRDPKTNQFVMEPVYVKDAEGKDTTEQQTDANGKPLMRRIEDANQFHTKMVVFPKDPLAAKWFFGVGINGSWYVSQGPNHEVWVPKMNDIANIEATYTQGEIDQRVGRSHVRQYGGSVSGRGGQVHGSPGMGVGFQ